MYSMYTRNSNVISILYILFRGEDIMSILLRVNNEVSQKEGIGSQPGARKQMPEIRTTMRKKLFLSPHNN